MDQISLKWNNHNSSVINSLDHFKSVDSFVDVTLVCEGHTVKAHKIILSAGSNVLRRLLLENPAKHPIIVLTETKYETLRMIIDFLYKGTIDIPRHDVNKVLQVATTFEINDLKNLCEESLNSKEVDSETNLHPCLKCPDLDGSSPKKKRQRIDSSDSDILFDALVPKREIDYSPCRLEQSEVASLTETSSAAAQTELDEFQPQIADARSVLRTSVELSAGNDSTGTCIQKTVKDASTECDLPLKELMCNSAPIKPARLKVKYNEITDDSESDTQNILEFSNTKRKRSTVWQYFTAVDPSYAVCRLCLNKFSYKTTVTNLTKHLLKKHKRFDPKRPPKLPEVPLLRIQNTELEIFEEVDFNGVEDEADIQNDEHLQYEQTLDESYIKLEEGALDESIPSTSTPCILKIT